MPMKKLQIGIVGYGNLGKGVELAIAQQPDMALQAIYTRRPPDQIKPQSPTSKILSVTALDRGDVPVDVLILCGGSRKDLPEQSPHYAALYNIVDSYDRHARIPEHLKNVDQAAKKAHRTAIIASGWDPGLFSIHRLYGEAILPRGKTYTFWGKGVSQGHSDAIRRVEGVADAVQYTLPKENALHAVRAGQRPALTPGESHRRECFVALKPGANADAVRKAITEMPDYFAPYETIVHFISLDELRRDHSHTPHGGFVFRSGETGTNTTQTIEFGLKLDSNPEFTANVLVAYARATYALYKRGDFGAKTVLEIPPILLSPKSPAELYRELL